MKIPVIVRKLHKWVALIIGVQLLCWVVGGLFMTAIPIKQVRGEHLRANAVEADWRIARVSPAEVLQQFPEAKLDKLSRFQGEPAYALVENHDRFLVSALTGERIPALDTEDVGPAALSYFAGTPGALTITRIDSNAPIEYRDKPLPAWQVRMGDADNTHVYIDALTGELTALRTGTWRVFDFFWMLHVMDYSTRDNFNHPLIISAASIALLVLLSGFMMLYFVLRRKKQSPH